MLELTKNFITMPGTPVLSAHGGHLRSPNQFLSAGTAGTHSLGLWFDWIFLLKDSLPSSSSINSKHVSILYEWPHILLCIPRSFCFKHLLLLISLWSIYSGPHLLVLHHYYSKHIDPSFTSPTPLEGTLTTSFSLSSFSVECRPGAGSALHGSYSEQLTQWLPRFLFLAIIIRGQIHVHVNSENQ